MRDDLTRMTKVEVVAAGDDVPAVQDILTQAGVTGYTAVAGVSGLGHDGFHQGRLLFNERSAPSLLITVVPEDRADAVVAGLRALFEERSGVLFVSDTYVSRPEYFR